MVALISEEPSELKKIEVFTVIIPNYINYSIRLNMNLKITLNLIIKILMETVI